MLKSFVLLPFLFFIFNGSEKQNFSNDIFCFACSECNKVVYFEQEGNHYWPNGFGCEVAVWHSWCNIGIYGNIKSQCKYCKIKVQTKYEPSGCIGDKKSCSVSRKKHLFTRIQ